MISKSDILSGMQFSLLNEMNPINTTDASPAVITYQYAGTSRPSDLPTGSVYEGWTSFTAADQIAFEAALAHIETFLNVDFVEVSGQDDPDLNVGQVTLPGSTAGYGGYSATYDSATKQITSYDSYVVYDNTLDLSDTPNLLLHELGHALGLKHPFSAPALPDTYESNKFTVMSYTDNPDNGLRSDAMMLFDVFATQAIWGAAEYNAGNTSYTGPRTETVDLIWDTGGRDTLDAGGHGPAVKLNLKPGSFSSFDTTDDMVIAFDTRIENATGGGGNDVLIGNAARNLLKGVDGSDVLRGNGGNDLLRGGTGGDTLKGGTGNDRLKGEAGNDKLLGQGGDDILNGGSGHDTLKSGLGRDTLDGGKGDDLLLGGGGRDHFVFTLGSGRDRIGDFSDDRDSLNLNGFGDLATVLDHASQVGDDVVFDFSGGDVLTVLDMTVDALSNDILIG
ncbi:metalloprotease [Pseudodonghicola xiamenensis]|uniref:Metalloprotease n=2 Tax=Pseudodonghicola xiamenensis TaxID=337702 RepID=A0A8J3H8N5_9RHOB|nr:metalloprotease [Pseudodonghicola xiamenensis]